MHQRFEYVCMYVHTYVGLFLVIMLRFSFSPSPTRNVRVFFTYLLIFLLPNLFLCLSVVTDGLPFFLSFFIEKTRLFPQNATIWVKRLHTLFLKSVICKSVLCIYLLN
jgi:hypothetical protein